MQHAAFEYRPAALWDGLCDGRGKAVIEVGIYCLVLTPVYRVVTAMVLFAVEERDGFYTGVTALVLLLTLAGRLLLH